MLCRRRLHRLRTPKTLAVLVVATVFLGIFMTYRTLSGHDASSQLSPSLPSLEKRKPRYKAAHSKNVLFNNRGHVRTKLNEQFNSGLHVPEVKEVLSLLYPVTWKNAKEPDEVAIILKDRMLGLSLPSPLTCRDIDEFQILGSLGQSNRKFVEKLEEGGSREYGSYDSRERYHKQRKLMAAKSQATDMQTKVACMKQIYNADFCGPMGNYLLMREVFLLRFLQHPNLIRLLGYCLRGDQVSMEMRKKGVVMVMEMGLPLIPSMLSSFSWAHRVQLALDATSLLEYLQASPLGSIGLPRVQLKDFVLINHKSLKLTDLDEAELGERECSSSSDCVFNGVDVGVKCQLSRCIGLNARTNLRTVGGYLLDPLLQQPPPEERTSVNELLARIRNLDISASELVNFMENLAKKYSVEEAHEDADGYQKLKDKARKRLGKQFSDRDEDEDDEEEDDEEDNKGAPAQVKHNGSENPQPENYLRLDSSNFPGQFDYQCSDSRVLWGCVMTFDSLEAAMDRCSTDVGCQSFVVFSSQPESESKMTVVFKSRSTGSPHVNLGTTLFIKKAKSAPSRLDPPSLQKELTDNEIPEQQLEGKGQEGKGQEGKGQEKKGPEDSGRKDPWEKVKEMQECVKRSQDNQVEALHSRERRLMAHMGLKGKQEKDWKRAVRIQTVGNFSSVRPLAGHGARGGTMLLHYDTSPAGHTVPRAKFMVEMGSKQNHVGFALVYHIDRLLGLYHTPPAVEGFISATLVEKFAGNHSWRSTFGSLVHPDGTLRGLYVAPTPKVMKRSELSLSSLTQMVSEVTAFDRTQKMQLEYVLLWWLGHIAKPGNLHRGFKGHLIHVDADQAFGEPAINYNGYFYHCQFPNVVYKMLMCFRCRASDSNNASANKICYLGQEVVRRLEALGFKLSDLHLDNLTEQDYPALINGAASSAIDIVDKCIQDFGREAVLY